MNNKVVLLASCFVMNMACRTSRDVCKVEERKENDTIFSLLAERHASAFYANVDFTDTLIFYPFSKPILSACPDSTFQDNTVRPLLASDGRTFSTAFAAVRHGTVRIDTNKCDTTTAACQASLHVDNKVASQASRRRPFSFTTVTDAAVWFVVAMAVAAFLVLAVRLFSGKL